MITPRPEPGQVWQAIDEYLARAYPTGTMPKSVAGRLEQLRAASGPDELYACAALERDPKEPDARFSLRLGNQQYPHMKLSIDRRPDRGGYLFRADTHDRHACPPPESKEYGLFCELMNKNQELAASIESAWADKGLPTFKTYLRDDLARRRDEASK